MVWVLRPSADEFAPFLESEPQCPVDLAPASVRALHSDDESTVIRRYLDYVADWCEWLEAIPAPLQRQLCAERFDRPTSNREVGRGMAQAAR